VNLWQVYQERQKLVEPKEKRKTSQVKMMSSITQTEKKASWKAECSSSLPNFDKVRAGVWPVEKWCESVDKVLSEYWRPTSLIRQSLVVCVDLPEFKRPSFDVNAFSVSDLLLFIIDPWHSLHEQRLIEVLLKKETTETWCQFLDRLVSWSKKRVRMFQYRRCKKYGTYFVYS